MSIILLKHWPQAARLIKNNTAPGVPGYEPVRLVTAGGTEYDLYEPGKLAVDRTNLLIYGMTIAGEQDVRLVRFARALASCGLRTATPVLSGLKAYRFAASDSQRLGDLVAALKQKDGVSPCIIAFSVGGSLALSLAAQPEMTGCIEKLLLFGPCYDLMAMWKTLSIEAPVEPTIPSEIDHFVWRQAVLAYRQQDALELPPAGQRRLTDFLWNYCEGFSLAEKRAFYEQALKSLPLQIAELDADETQAIRSLSLQGRLENFRGKVSILHDPLDKMIPVENSLQILAELRQRGLPGAQRLLVTPLIAHVSPRFAWKLGDALCILDILGELFRL